MALSSKFQDLTLPLNLSWAFSYLHNLLNSKLFLSSVKLTTDARMDMILGVHRSNPYSFATKWYPKLYPITLDIYEGDPLPGDLIDNGEEEEDEDAVKIAVLPQNLPLSKQYLGMTGVFLFDSGEELLVFVQGQAPPELLMELFATESWEDIEAGGLPEL